MPASAEQLCQRVTEQLVPAGGGDDDIAVVALRIVPVEATLRVRFAADPQILSQMRRMLGRWLQEHGAQPTRSPPSRSRAARRAPTRSSMPMLPAWPTSSSRRLHADGLVTLTVRDTGRWRAPRGTNRGRGLKIIAAAVDELDLHTTDAGTEVVMRRRLGRPR